MRALVVCALLAVGCAKSENDDWPPLFPVYPQVIVGDLPTERGGGNGNVYAPDILVEGGTWRMWYGGQGGDGHDRIHLAESSDGLTWTKRGVVLDNGASNHVNDPSVVKVAGVYWMFYTDAAVGITDRIHAATSSDGVLWTKRGEVIGAGPEPWRTSIVGRPSVLHDGAAFRMWFDATGSTPGRHVGYAESTDGLTWTVASPVTQGGAVHVSVVSGVHVMLLEGREGVYRCESADGLLWGAQWLWRPNTGAHDAHGRVTPFLIDGTLYYGGAMSADWTNNAICRE